MISVINKKIVLLGSGFVFFSLGLFLMRGEVLRAAGLRLIVNELPQKSDAVVVLSGSDLPERIRGGVKLLQEGYAPRIILSGHMSLQRETGMDLMRAYTLQLGAAPEQILRDPSSLTTDENAVHVRQILIAHGWKSMLLVTSPFHTFRAQKVFKRTLPEDIRITVKAADVPGVEGVWWQNAPLFREFVYECLNLCRMFFTMRKER